MYKLPLITNELALDLLVNNFHLEFSPGEKYSYSNSNYFLLAMIIEKVTGLKYSDFLKENIFRPLKMKNTYAPDEFTDSIPGRINAYSYYWNKTEYDLQDRVSGHGNIYSTIYDQYLFDQALYSDKLVKQETLNEAFDFNQFIDSKRGYRYGLGWRIEGKDSSAGIVSHRGSIGGFKSLLWRDIINKNTLIILSNNWWLVDIPEIINGAQNIIQGKQYDLAKISIQAFFLDNWYMYGFNAAENKMQKVITENPDKYNYKEDLLNDLAYFFFYRKDDSAMNIIDFALEIYPNSANLWDSKGEMSMKFRDKQTAISSFEQSLKLNPDNENAKQMIKKLGK